MLLWLHLAGRGLNQNTTDWNTRFICHNIPTVASTGFVVWVKSKQARALLMETGIKWGDIATWVAGIGTIATFFVAFLQIRTERDARNRREEETHIRKTRDQAEHVSSWIVKESSDHSKLWVAISNQSTRPVYQVIVSLVMIQGSGPREGIDTPSTEQVCLSAAPPGVIYVSIPADYHGMSRHPGIEIAFKDATGKCWVRKGSGDLVEIEKLPVEYYDISLPTSWRFGEMVIPEEPSEKE